MITKQTEIREVMTKQPHWIHASEPVTKAKYAMEQHRIRHLPVMNNERVIGMLSDRDLKITDGIEGLNPATLVVMDICHGKPYTVDLHTPLGQVAETMARNHYGSAIVVDKDQLVGIFTTVDACRALATTIEDRSRG